MQPAPWCCMSDRGKSGFHRFLYFRLLIDIEEWSSSLMLSHIDTMDPNKGKSRPGLRTTTGRQMRLHQYFIPFMRIDKFMDVVCKAFMAFSLSPCVCLPAL